MRPASVIRSPKFGGVTAPCSEHPPISTVQGRRKVGAGRKPSHTTMSSNAELLEVYSCIQRHRRYSVDEKLRIVQEASQPGITNSYVARRHGISPSLLFHWGRRMAEGGKEAARVDEDLVGSSEVKALEKRIRELERVLGKKTLENEILREAVKVALEKK